MSPPSAPGRPTTSPCRGPDTHAADSEVRAVERRPVTPDDPQRFGTPMGCIAKRSGRFYSRAAMKGCPLEAPKLKPAKSRYRRWWSHGSSGFCV